MKRALILCPGRGSYTRNDLGTLTGLTSESLAPFDTLRASAGRPTVRELDAAERFSARKHVAGENASILTAGIALADLDQLDGERIRPVAVCGNSMGWYTALGYAGALSLPDCARLVETMGQYQAGNVIGGQIVYPLANAQWRIVPERLAAVEAAVAAIDDLHWSIRLGGQAVLAGTEAALAAAGEHLPALTVGSYTYPLRLPLHSAFHTPMLAGASQQAQVDLADLAWSTPRLPLIDGAGQIWRPRIADTAALADYTLGAQVSGVYDFTTMLKTALREYAPDCVILPGPGSSLGGAIAQTLIAEGWQGLHCKDDFIARQAADPILISLRWPDQRALACR
ncbi:MAG: [acyl-carrier-protein] S-malonyltransferase [Myxococcota bacterium]|jgi:[acyl-carrier-protein] S-malonyltransferase